MQSAHKRSQAMQAEFMIMEVTRRRGTMQHPGCTHRQDSRIGLRFACGNGGGDDSGDEDEEEEEYEEAGIR